MALTEFQRNILRLLAPSRLEATALQDALERKAISLHRGTIGGAWPVFP